MRHKSKKMVMVVLTGLLVFGLVACGSPKEEETAKAPVTEQPKEEKSKLGNLTDDLWVEIQAQLMYEAKKVLEKYGGKVSKIPSDEAGKYYEDLQAAAKKVYGKFGVTKEEMNAYYEKVGKESQQRLNELNQRMIKRMEELNK